jgi:5-methyltetrahydrofolate--homocysteine methyltransferase
VVHVLDASRAVGVAGTLVSDTLKEALVAETAAEYEKIRIQRAGGGQSALVPLEQARANGFPTDFAAHPPVKPNFTGTMTIDDVRVETLIPYIDWTPFFRAWELHGNYPAILTDAVVGESATSLFADAQAMLKRIVAEEWLHPKGVISIWPVRREGDDVVLFGDESRTAPLARLPFLRQQIAKRDGRANMCLADFIHSEADWLGCFAVQAGEGIDAQLAHFKAAHDDYNDILLKALADRLAEAFAEYLHERVRREIWGHEQGNKMSCDDLIRERYTGIRPAPGYPACPDHVAKKALFALLDAEAATGCQLTSSCAIDPAASVAGWYFGHPEARYFGVGRIGADQVAEYAARVGLTLDEANAWLAANLD